MAGINLSPSVQGGKTEKRSLFDRGLMISLTLFLLVAGLWGGMRWYIKTLNDDIASLDQALSEHAAELRGMQVDRIVDFDNRLSLMAKNIDGALDPKQILEQAESLVIPSVILREYEYNPEDGTITVGGETENFKYLAQQIISLKSQPIFGELKVDTINRTKEGRIAFTLTAGLSGK